MAGGHFCWGQIHEAAGYAVDELELGCPRAFSQGEIFVLIAWGEFELYGLIEREATKCLVADIDSVEIDVFSAFVGDETEAAIGGDTFNGAVEHASSVTHAREIHQRLLVAISSPRDTCTRGEAAT